MKRILVVEDEVMIRGELARFLRRHGYEAVEAGSVDEALAAGPAGFDAVLADVRLPGRQGTELVGQTGGKPVLLMTSYATVQGAVRSMRLGAVDYLSKPFDLDELLAALESILEGRSVAVPAPAPDFGILGESPPIVALRARVRKLAPSEATVLVLGPSGTGKELVARGLHLASPRASGPFVAVNCAAIPENLVESELFGHQRGAFTGATSTRQGLVQSAEGGTLFLDEVGELPQAVQARLLRFLQTGEVRVVGTSRTQIVKTRLVAATHRDLALEAKRGTFRDDLYFRLRVLEIRVPTLAERGDDVLLLAHAFLTSAAARAGVTEPVLSPAAENALLGHRWPGHVRELENAIERAVVLAEEGVIEPEHLSLDDAAPVSEAPPSTTDLSLGEYFRQTVLEHQGTLTETELAKRLGVSRKTLWERRQRLGLPRSR
ncbi:MAG: fis [Labilithrix sp.]|nr:fis [Labilithrix sp.]